MKLAELAARRPTEQIAKVFESYFGSRIQFEQLSGRQASQMLNKVRGILGEHRSTSARHSSEQNPNYLKLVMMEQALVSRIKEAAIPAPVAQPAAGSTQVDPKLKAAQDKIKKGVTLSAEEQKMVNDNAASVSESRLRRAYRYLKESEVQQAQVVLAAQDMVDKMQGMLEDVTELQFKELPALVDSIKNQVGIEQATQFNQDATAALSGLVQNLQGAKLQLDAALGVVTGQAPAPIDGGMPSPDLEAGADMAAGADLGAAADDLDAAGADIDALGAEEPEMGAPAASLGRERR